MRKLSDLFIHDLKSAGGRLYSLLERVKHDHTLMLAIRNNRLNIYYRGGSLLSIEEGKTGAYRCHFDTKYNTTGEHLPELPRTVKGLDDVAVWIRAFSQLKHVMDMWFSKHQKAEREFQQLIARENNFSNIAKSSDYFISDIEFVDSGLHARFDMLAVRRINRPRGTTTWRPALVEVKYGDGALGGPSGFNKHLRDMDALIADKAGFANIRRTMEDQVNQLNKLGLLRLGRNAGNDRIKLSAAEKPEVIFVLANHNPRSRKLAKILNDPDVLEYGHSERFDLRFFVASFAGYGFHERCMLDLDQFRELLASQVRTNRGR